MYFTDLNHVVLFPALNSAQSMSNSIILSLMVQIVNRLTIKLMYYLQEPYLSAANFAKKCGTTLV